MIDEHVNQTNFFANLRKSGAYLFGIGKIASDCASDIGF